MGICMSSSRDALADHNMKPSSAHVVSIGGEVRQYPVPITVSQVLHSEFASLSSPPAFLCNSDRLYFDDYIPALRPDEELLPGQIYFVLPTSKLQYRLSASDMAALAVKASLGLESQKNSSGRKKKKKKARISPVLVEVEQREEDANPVKAYYNNDEWKKKQRPSSSGLGVSRSGSLTKVQRYSSRRAKLAVRSFRIRLTTIYEGSVLVFN